MPIPHEERTRPWSLEGQRRWWLGHLDPCGSKRHRFPCCHSSFSGTLGAGISTDVSARAREVGTFPVSNKNALCEIHSPDQVFDELDAAVVRKIELICSRVGRFGLRAKRALHFRIVKLHGGGLRWATSFLWCIPIILLLILSRVEDILDGVGEPVAFRPKHEDESKRLSSAASSRSQGRQRQDVVC
jgi:hypothetical protein